VSVLVDRLLAVHGALDAARLPHAFGGAIALAYCTEEPRGTRDIDVNVFVDASHAPEVLSSLPTGVVVTDGDVQAALTDGQVRLWWDETPVDVFLDVHDFHREVAAGARIVPFAGTDIPVLGCVELVVFKAFFSRTKDWADIEAILDAGTVDITPALGWLVRLLGADHDSTKRLAALTQPAR
jgi:hypothetical protein